MTNLCDFPVTKNEIADALNGAKLLLAALDLEHNSIADAIAIAYKKWGRFGDIEINGRYAYRNGVLPIPEENIEFIRIESFSEPGVKGDFMDCYISTDAALHKDKPATKLLPKTLVFDYYPRPGCDDYIDSLSMDDCKAVLDGKLKVPTK